MYLSQIDIQHLCNFPISLDSSDTPCWCEYYLNVAVKPDLVGHYTGWRLLHLNGFKLGYILFNID